MLQVCGIMVSVSHMKCHISKHMRQQRGRASALHNLKWTGAGCIALLKVNAMSLRRRRLQSRWMPNDSDDKTMVFHKFETELRKKTTATCYHN
jgi:hypothetical protein